jgi:hypothetical protein
MIVRTEHTLTLAGLNPQQNGLRIAHLTDLHRSRLTRDSLLREAVRVANAARPDLVVLTGDYVTDDPADIAPCADLLSRLCARLGVYAILGNHDYGTDGDAMANALQDLGFTLLINKNVTLDGGLRLVGLDDEIMREADVPRAFDGVPENAPTLVLCHNPALVERFSDRVCVALAGHTHGGQILLPYLTARRVRLIRAKRYRQGWFTVGKARLYVNRGVGNVGVPLRFLAPPEVALFTLAAANGERQ